MLDLALDAQYCHGRYSPRHCVYIVPWVVRISRNQRALVMVQKKISQIVVSLLYGR